MGWGRKTAGAVPQPALPALDDGPELSEKAAAALRVKYAPQALVLSESVILNVPSEKPSDAAKAEATWASFRSRKGWVPETVAMLLYEFVKERGLFTELLAFAKRRK